MRLDIKLTELYDISRQKAQDALKQGRVFVNGNNVSKNSFEVSETDLIELKHNSTEFVSRAGHKLEEVLLMHSVDVAGCNCIDIGSSTGGFTDCLLQNGALSMTCVDVGTSQLHPKLREDKRVIVMENTNARHLSVEKFPHLFDLLVMDVSFISVRLLLENVAALVKSEGKLFVLFKPQFEVGRKFVSKSGVVTNLKEVEKSLQDFRQWCRSLDLLIHDCHVSSLTGRKGNQEYVFYLSKK